MEVSPNYGYLCGGPHTKDYSILGGVDGGFRDRLGPVEWLLFSDLLPAFKRKHWRSLDVEAGDRSGSGDS